MESDELMIDEPQQPDPLQITGYKKDTRFFLFLSAQLNRNMSL